MHLLKSWRVSFDVTNKSCQTRNIAREDDLSHKMWQIAWTALKASLTHLTANSQQLFNVLSTRSNIFAIQHIKIARADGTVG